MYIKEKVEANKVNAPTLFIGTGGIGCRIIKGIADRCVKDDTSNIRFLAMDTDVNDLTSINKGAKIVTIQTSSTSTVESYLDNDREAKHNWFPENKMLDSKTVSEGAGQVRAISRLALNDIIKNGKIHTLYKAIDDLFLKDGGDLKQAVRVVIASTAAGGTGSGIAMELGMLVRHYVKKNYPESAVMIRGFLVMPGVMDTVIKSQSERDSQRCNGYATIKEINAFMMKGSGFFDTVPELFRYKDLHITVPNASSGEEKISNLPFDFCFLLDRTDSNAGNMTTLDQYIDYAAQSLYEQNIGPMRKRASSMEDNVLKLCINPDKLGRCRFGGTGASILKYPYDDIRDYIALNWTRSSIIGSSSDSRLTEEERKALLCSSWLQYDEKFTTEHKLWDENPNSNSKNEPKLPEVYMSTVEAGRDPKSGNDFTMMLWDKFLQNKIDMLGDEEDEKTIAAVAKRYIDSLVSGVTEGQLENEYGLRENKTFALAQKNADAMGYETRYNTILSIEDIASSQRFVDIVRSFTKEVFNSKASSDKEDLGEYMLEKFLSVNGRIMHPNAARYLLYKLEKAIEAKIVEANSFVNSFDEKKMRIIEAAGGEDDKKSDDKFAVALHLGHESDLREMCMACDKLKNFDNVAGNPGERCNELLKKYYNIVRKYFNMIIAKEVCDIARTTVSNLIKSYESFYATFGGKIPSIEKKKEDIITHLTFRNGDCVRYLLGKKAYLDKLTASIGRPTESGEEASKLYSEIFMSLRNNAYIEARRNVNPFHYEAKKDIFDDIIIEYYKKRVDDTCDIINVKGILHAIKLEYDVKSALELDETNIEKKEEKALEIHSESSLHKYVKELISNCRNLASPGIKKKDNDEPRDVDAIACSSSITDGEGLRVSDFIPGAIESPTISKYELHFFRSVYNIMPTQLAKLSAPTYDDKTDEFSISSENEYEQLAAGDYFRIYQKYMDRIGPDSETSAIITPHVDMRWNAISVMPELDTKYQKRLMRKIHKTMIYGFVYNRIHLFTTSDEAPEERVYKYLNADNDAIDLMVSNKTKCDVLYEVLDSLYFDRMAVSVIRAYVNRLRNKNESAGFRSHNDVEFFKRLKQLRYKKFTNNEILKASDEKVSLFTIVLAYCNSLPVQKKDMAEMKTMVEAIVEMLYSEMQICTSNKESLYGRVADVLVEQFNCLIDNYNNNQAVLKCGIFSDQVIGSIRRTLSSFMSRCDVESYIDKMAEFEEN